MYGILETGVKNWIVTPDIIVDLWIQTWKPSVILQMASHHHQEKLSFRKKRHYLRLQEQKYTKVDDGSHISDNEKGWKKLDNILHIHTSCSKEKMIKQKLSAGIQTLLKKSNTHPDCVNSCITVANPLTGCVTEIHSSCDIVRTRNQIITNLIPL